jgi:hypothetical protein
MSKKINDGLTRWQRFYRRHKEERLAYGRKWCQEHKEQRQAIDMRCRQKRKLEILGHYSDEKLVCAKCGFSDIRALTIDHIEGGGCKHRRELKTGSGEGFYQWLKRNNFPEGYQVLCSNCQLIKRMEEGEDKKWRLNKK